LAGRQWPAAVVTSRRFFETETFMNDNVALFLTIFTLDLILVPFFIVVGVLFPKRVAKTQGILDLMPGRAFAVGLVNFVFFLAVGMVFFILADKTDGLLKAILTIPALAIFTVLAITLSFGLTGMVNLIGERIAPSQSSWRRAFWGTLLLGIGCTVPLVGWFLLLPYASCAGIGAFITSFFQPNKPPLSKE
jgi:hypothetical protein